MVSDLGTWNTLDVPYKIVGVRAPCHGNIRGNFSAATYYEVAVVVRDALIIIDSLATQF